MAGEIIHLRRDGVSVVVDATVGLAPAIAHWGEDLGPVDDGDWPTIVASLRLPVPNNALRDPVRVGILPFAADGWLGEPGVSGARLTPPQGERGAPLAFAPRLVSTAHAVETDADGRATGMRIGLGDDVSRLSGALELRLDHGGVLRVRTRIRNDDEAQFELHGVRMQLPLPERAEEILDFTGRWARERIPQRSSLTDREHARVSRRGRTGADGAFILHAGTSGFDEEHGEVWAVHVGFSGDHVHSVERRPLGGAVIGGGELLMPGEVRLEAGEEWESPWLHGSHGRGLTQVAQRFHRLVRARDAAPRRTGAVTLNVWEAVYFDQDVETLRALADVAAEVGVERFVLDDGWFSTRRDDRSGLGDWTVSEDVWPDGLHPLVDHVRSLDMEFGLWVEPEMVNPDSKVAREHPEWIMSASAERLPPESRHQQVLDLAVPEAFDHVHGQLRELVRTYAIDALKWDHNRDLVEAGDRRTTAPRVHAQTLAAYRLMDALREEFPHLQIESSSSGGSRIDLGVLQRTDRVWASDCIDPVERVSINRWTAQLVPPELIGSHVGAPVSHTTGRTHGLGFRAAPSLLHHLGVEWNLLEATAAERAELSRWIALHRELRDLIADGDHRTLPASEGIAVSGVVSPDRRDAAFVLTSLRTLRASTPAPLRVLGLDPALRYRLTAMNPSGVPGGYVPAGLTAGAAGAADPAHSAGRSAASEPFREYWGTLPGSVLGGVGIALPIVHPEQAIVLRVEAVGEVSPGHRRGLRP